MLKKVLFCVQLFYVIRIGYDLVNFLPAAGGVLLQLFGANQQLLVQRFVSQDINQRQGQ